MNVLYKVQETLLRLKMCHLQFMKQTLKFKMATNSCVVYAETWRFPLCVFNNMCMIKHWLKILNMNVKQLVHVAYIFKILLTDSRSNKYSSKIEDTRHIHTTYTLLQIKYNNIYCTKKET